MGSKSAGIGAGGDCGCFWKDTDESVLKANYLQNPSIRKYRVNK